MPQVRPHPELQGDPAAWGAANRAGGTRDTGATWPSSAPSRPPFASLVSPRSCLPETLPIPPAPGLGRGTRAGPSRRLLFPRLCPGRPPQRMLPQLRPLPASGPPDTPQQHVAAFPLPTLVQMPSARAPPAKHRPTARPRFGAGPAEHLVGPGLGACGHSEEARTRLQVLEHLHHNVSCGN